MSRSVQAAIKPPPLRGTSEARRGTQRRPPRL
jgi:hypothetical protein